jgi:hypothetical protein
VRLRRRQHTERIVADGLPDFIEQPIPERADLGEAALMLGIDQPHRPRLDRVMFERRDQQAGPIACVNIGGKIIASP